MSQCHFEEKSYHYPFQKFYPRLVCDTIGMLIYVQVGTKLEGTADIQRASLNAKNIYFFTSSVDGSYLIKRNFVKINVNSWWWWWFSH